MFVRSNFPTRLRDNIRFAAIDAINATGVGITLRAVSAEADIECIMDSNLGPCTWASTATMGLPNTQVIRRAEIRFNALFDWSNQSRNIHIAIHELLHALGLSDEYCSDCMGTTIMWWDVPGGDYFTDVDPEASRALECRYGPLEGGCSSTFGLIFDWQGNEPNRRLVVRSNCASCLDACSAAPSAPNLRESGSNTYELAIRDSTGIYDVVATLAEDDWINDRYELAITRSYAQAILRVRVYSAGELVDELHTHPPVNLTYETTGVGASDRGRPALLRILENPVHDRLDLEFTIAEEGLVEIGVFDVAGRLVQRLVRARYPAGTHAFRAGRASALLAPGIHFVKLRCGDAVSVKPIARLR